MRLRHISIIFDIQLVFAVASKSRWKPSSISDMAIFRGPVFSCPSEETKQYADYSLRHCSTAAVGSLTKSRFSSVTDVTSSPSRNLILSRPIIHQLQVCGKHTWDCHEMITRTLVNDFFLVIHVNLCFNSSEVRKWAPFFLNPSYAVTSSAILLIPSVTNQILYP